MTIAHSLCTSSQLDGLRFVIKLTQSFRIEILSFLFLLNFVTGASRVSLLNEAESDTLALGEGDKGLLALTNHEDVGKTSGERVATSILNVGDLVGTGMVLNVLKDTDSANIVSTDNEDGGTVLELDEAVNLVGLEVKLHSKRQRINFTAHA